MALTQTQVSQLYVTLFGRASEGSGNTYWQNSQSDVAVAAQAMLDTAAAKTYFGTSMDDNEAFIKHIYKNTLNKTEADDAAGIKFWVDALNAGNSRGFIVSELLKAAVDPKNAGDAQNLFNNKVEVSNYTANKVANVASASQTDLAPFVEAINKVTATSTTEAKAYVDTIKDTAADNSTTWISTPTVPGETYTLTNHTDKATANVFNAPMVYNPAGSDRILSLQDEDVLTGTAGRTDNTLNVEMGQANADEGTGTSRTPTLKNIQYVNAEFTGSTSTLDLRYSDSVTKVNVEKVTQLAGNNVNIEGISSVLQGMRVANAAKKDANIKFESKQGVLAGTSDSSLLELNNVIAGDVTIKGDSPTPEGYEKLQMTAKNGVQINSLIADQLQELTVTGSGILKIAKTKIDDANQPEFTQLEDGGVVANGSTGLTKLDASGFNGTLTLDVSKVINPATNPYGSGRDIPVSIIGSGNDDVFYTKTAPGKNTQLNGGAGEDKLVVVSASVSGDGEKISNIETLELRNQANKSQSADLSAFIDNALKTVLVRDEKKSAGTSEFTIKNVTGEFAKNGKFVIEHSVTTGTPAGTKDVKLNVELKDASAADDSVTVQVNNANNTENTFDYELNIDGKKAATESVENVTVIDNDTESNIVKFTAVHTVGADTEVSDHTGTVTLKGGTEGLDYTVESTLYAKTIDASEQKSNLRLTVKDQVADVGQTIKLGSGNDILTFKEIDGFDAKDVISDNGGHDVVRAAFSKDSTLNLTGIEELHVVANKNVTLDIEKAQVEKVVVLSDQAAGGHTDIANNGAADPFNVTGVDTTKIITFKNSKLTDLNFFGDLDTTDQDGTEADPYVDEATAQKFNGVKLENNSVENLNVNINSSLDAVAKGAATYDVGQLTLHGSKNIVFNIGDEKKDGSTQTTINNVIGKDIQTIVANSKGNLKLGTVTTNAQNNSITSIDATNVVGKFEADVIGLGDGAKVKLGDGNNDFKAIGSAGKLIEITAGKGDNKITGSAQSDFITAGDGHNDIKGDRGDNVMTVGAGDDKVQAKDGNDTVVLGKGYDSYDDNISTSINTVQATTAVTKQFGAAKVRIDKEGNGMQATDVNQWIAVGDGSELKVQWTGTDIDLATTVLDGARAKTSAGAEGFLNDGTDTTIAGTENADLWINKTVDKVYTINGGAGNDVYITAGASTLATAVKFNGGDGNDAAVGGNFTDHFTGGKGADVFVMQNQATVLTTGARFVDGNVDVVKIADGDSVAGSHDVLYGFDVNTAPSTGAVPSTASAAANAGRDILDLDNDFSAVAATAAQKAINGDDVGSISAHSVGDNNFVTFYSEVTNTLFNGVIEGKDGVAGTTATNAEFDSTLAAGKYSVAGTKATIINKDNLADALAYLAKHYDGTGKTVAFAYDRNGDGKIDDKDSTFVFQDGLNDTVVELVGTADASGLTNAKAGIQGATSGAANDGLINIG